MAERNTMSWLSIPAELKLRSQWPLWRRRQPDLSDTELLFVGSTLKDAKTLTAFFGRFRLII